VIVRIRRFLEARVGRRLFFLFVLSAFVPLAALAALSYVQLRDILLEQGQQRLAATAKGFGTALFDRLLQASDLASASLGPQAPAANSLARRTFVSLAQIQPDGRVVARWGEPPLKSLEEPARGRLEEGKSTLLVRERGNGYQLVLVAPGAVSTQGAAVAELASEAFWQTEMLPAATDFCVVVEDGRTPLFCSVLMPDSVVRASAERKESSAISATRWMRSGEPQRAAAWSQYLRAGFGTTDWVVVASQSEGFILSKLIEYQRIYVPVVILALLLVMWLTIRQSRSIVDPVSELVVGARAISRKDFSRRVEVNRSDEFGELADAFNRMSEKLGRQFAALTALSEIDQLILSTLDTAQVARIVLERMGDVVPANFIGLTLFDPDNRELGHSYFRDMQHNDDGVVFSRLQVRPEDRVVLEANRSGSWIGLEDEATGLLLALRERGMRTAYIHPIVWRQEVCGALAVGYVDPSAGNDEERQQARDFADRVAVAVSSAWRDEQLYQHAHYDVLTGLPNRLLLKDRLGQEIARSQREERRFAVLFVDIDRFKSVNDTLGHTAGDAVLCEAARRVSGCIRSSDTVARLGGDEFTVLLTNVRAPQDAGHIAEAIVRELSRAFELEGQSIFLSASVGIAAFPRDGATAEALLRNADTAMYRAKFLGRAQAVYFEERMNDEAVARLTLDRDLRSALELGQLSVHYQPLIDLRTGEVVGAEALMRWLHPERGWVPPSRFIPVAEESGFIEELGAFALAQACVQMRAWRDDGLRVRRVSVNVSPRQLRKPGMSALIERSARDAGIDLEALQIEITEGLLIDHAERAGVLLREVADTGATIALDDFGTGFSSMAYLNRFPIHTIKIDRVFVDGIESGRNSAAIVEAIIAMSHALGKTVVAEGVETAGQLEILRALRCDEVQGFHIAPPMPAKEFAVFVREQLASREGAAAGSL
jgi:diguanylate cyclase (GGDEF)-like protein